MISGIDLKATVEYCMKDDKENPTVWILGPLTSSALSRIASASGAGDPMKQMVELVRFGVKGWRNFKLGEQEVEFKTDVDGSIPISLLDIIPIKAIIELGTELLAINKLSPKEIKN